MKTTSLYRPVNHDELMLIVELWVPSEELEEFNQNIVGKIIMITKIGGGEA